MALAKKTGFFSDSQRILLPLKHPKAAGRSITLEFFPCDFNPAFSAWQRVRDKIVTVSSRVYQDKVAGDQPGYRPERIEKYLQPTPAADLVAAWEADTFLGFAITREFITQHGNTFHFVLTLMDPASQGLGISTFMQAKQADDFMTARHLTETRISLDSPNPVVIGTMTRSLRNPYPNPQQPDLRPTTTVRQIASAIVAELYPEADFNSKLFVIRDWYLHTPDLRYRAAKIPSYHDERVNAFCEARLRLTQDRGDKMVVLGAVTKEMTEMVLNYYQGE